MGAAGHLRIGSQSRVQVAALRAPAASEAVRLVRITRFERAAASFEALGFVPGGLFVAANVFAECAGGVFPVAGLREPAAAAAIISVMIVAIVTVHWPNGLLAAPSSISGRRSHWRRNGSMAHTAAQKPT